MDELSEPARRPESYLPFAGGLQKEAGFEQDGMETVFSLSKPT